ncbi:hypothetical protein [Streptomyces sp. NBC_01614]|uniref:Uncharacterized protein n=1 Tax=Streptomyces sp. NBC_00180 TaxID=2903632 RepID=A0AAU1I1T9_9ACTN
MLRFRKSGLTKCNPDRQGGDDQSWLVVVGVVVFGGALVGRLLYEEPHAAHALKLRS